PPNFRTNRIAEASGAHRGISAWLIRVTWRRPVPSDWTIHTSLWSVEGQSEELAQSRWTPWKAMPRKDQSIPTGATVGGRRTWKGPTTSTGVTHIAPASP